MAPSFINKKVIAIAVVLAIIAAIIIAYNVYPMLKNDEEDNDDNDNPEDTNSSPWAQWKAIYQGVDPLVGEIIYFNASESGDTDGDVLIYQWDFDGDKDNDGDGDPENDNEIQGMNVSKVFLNNGTYLVVLTVIDPHGAFDTEKRNFKVFLPDEDAPYAILTPAGKKGGFTGTKYSMTVASVDLVRLAVNYTVEIWDIEGENRTVIYNSPVANLTAGVTYTDFDLDRSLTPGDSFIITPNEDLPVTDGDYFILYYGRDQVPAGEMFFASIGL